MLSVYMLLEQVQIKPPSFFLPLCAFCNRLRHSKTKRIQKIDTIQYYVCGYAVNCGSDYTFMHANSRFIQDFLVILYKFSCIFGYFLHFYTNFAKSLAIPTGSFI